MLLLLTVGCSTKDKNALFDSFDKEKSYYKNLQRTEKIQLYDENNTTKALVVATYLAPKTYKAKDRAEEMFIVGVYFEEEWETEPGKIYTLELDGQKPLKVESLSRSDKLLKNKAFVTEWSTYYKITFPHVSKESFMLTFESKKYGKGQLNFAKVAKYMLEKEKKKK
jgi:hypothetical protein